MRLPNPALIKEFAARTVPDVPDCICRCEFPCRLVTHHEPTKGSAHLETRITLARIHWCFHETHRHGGMKGKAAADKIIEAICNREKCVWENRQEIIWLLKRAPFKTQEDARREWFEAEVDRLCWRPEALALLRKTLTEAGVT
jgi:hypothetical protein